jgi:Domain of unknown function (DUF4252)
MKSLAKKIITLAASLTLAFLTVTTARAQDAKIQTAQLEAALAAKASQTVTVDLNEKVLSLAWKFLSDNDPDDKKVKELVSGLKGIYVKSFSFENEGQYSDADLESIRSQLRGSAWTKVVNVFSRKDGNLDVYLMEIGGKINGLALLAADPKEITVVNIVGPVDLEKLTELEGTFNIPELGIEKSKPKRKN